MGDIEAIKHWIATDQSEAATRVRAALRGSLVDLANAAARFASEAARLDHRRQIVGRRRLRTAAQRHGDADRR